MLKRLLNEWLFAFALVIFVGFWGLVLTVSRPTPVPKNTSTEQQTRTSPNLVGTQDDAWWHYSGAWTAAFTLVLTVSTALLWYVTWQAARAAREATEIATKEYVSTHRPRLKIRLLRLDTLRAGEPITVEFEVVNIGDSRATIESSEITLDVRSVPISTDKIGNAIWDSCYWTQEFKFIDGLDAGASATARVKTGLVLESRWVIHNMVEGEIDPHWINDRFGVVGTVVYFDDNRVKRRLGFYRRSTDDINRFCVPNFDKTTMDDYEYQD